MSTAPQKAQSIDPAEPPRRLIDAVLLPPRNSETPEQFLERLRLLGTIATVIIPRMLADETQSAPRRRKAGANVR